MWKKTKDEYKKNKYSCLGDSIWKCRKTEQWILHIGKTGEITYHETMYEAKLAATNSY